MKKRIEETWLPIFPGFYNTIFEPDETSEIDYLNEQRVSNGLKAIETGEYDSIGWNYRAFENEVAQDCTNVIGDELIKLGFINSYKFEAIESPKEYNFRNDTVNIGVGYNQKNARNLYKYVKANFKDFAEHVKEKCSSRSGFISHHSAYAVVWLEETNKLQSFAGGYKLGFVLEWALIHSLEAKDELNGDDPQYWLYNNINDMAMLQINDYTKATTAPYCTECKEFIEYPISFIPSLGLCEFCAKNGETITTPIDIIAKGGDFSFDSELLRKVNQENGTDFKGLWELKGVYYGSPTSLPSTDVVIIAV
jgi:hypothetical protein